MDEAKKKMLDAYIQMLELANEQIKRGNAIAELATANIKALTADE